METFKKYYYKESLPTSDSDHKHWAIELASRKRARAHHGDKMKPTVWKYNENRIKELEEKILEHPIRNQNNKLKDTWGDRRITFKSKE